jgi:MFS family permease
MAAGTIGDVRLLAPLRERDFALLWTGMTVSLLGDGIFIVAEAWQVYDIHNDPVALSLVGLAWTGGMTAFLLTGGIISDRVERRRVLIAADLARAVVLAVHSLDWFVSIGLTPVSFALTGPVSKAIGVDTTLILAGVLPMLVCGVLYLVANLRRDEELYPLLGDYAVAGSS